MHVVLRPTGSNKLMAGVSVVAFLVVSTSAPAARTVAVAALKPTLSVTSEETESTIVVLQRTAETAEALQGRWVVIGGEHNQQPVDSLNGGIMTIRGSRFEIRTASGNLLQGTLELDPSVAPHLMDMRHDDGTHWEAVYEVTGEALSLNYVNAEFDDPRPDSATSTAVGTEESVIRLQRQDAP